MKPEKNPFLALMEKRIAFLQYYADEENKKIEKKKNDPFGYALEKFYEKAEEFRETDRDAVYMKGKHKAVVEELVKRGHKAKPVLGVDAWYVSIYNNEADLEEAFERDFRERMEADKEKNVKYTPVGDVPKFIDKLRNEGYTVKKNKFGSGYKVLIPRSDAERDELFEKDFRERLLLAVHCEQESICTEGTPEFINRLRSRGYTVTKDKGKLWKVKINHAI
ncbi:Hypothetical protein ZAZAV_31 [Cedratvirus Zaza IHUMI]|uniref:Uncharacterized protein n=1 Tax=Cedratvirus Zaza IHUMI TaxID=2126979 RepID=A0A2R8FD66_9VIRU|nr:Hypothetical protein ZAZAV_31 [Cedratvirus Zaza IHUMI]